MSCANCPAEAEYRDNNPAANSVDYCAACLPADIDAERLIKAKKVDAPEK